jgi:uncharacterized protein YjlB
MNKDPEKYHFKESENIPNNPDLPALLYREVVDSSKSSQENDLKSRFKENGWSGIWRWSVYDFHHYHSNAHEVLGVTAGEAKLQLGGPDGKTVSVSAGDMIVLPAGTGHKKLDSSEDFEVVGAYPSGQENKDLIRNNEAPDEAIQQRIREVALPHRDPVYGADGPLLDEWR